NSASTAGPSTTTLDLDRTWIKPCLLRQSLPGWHIVCLLESHFQQAKTCPKNHDGGRYDRERELVVRVMALPRPGVLPRLAGCEGPLQTGGAGGGVGHHPAAAEHGGVHTPVQPAGGDLQRRGALPAVLLRRAGPLGVLFRGGDPGRAEPAGELPPHYQG